MAYTSLGFLAFLGLVIMVYYLVPKKYQWIVLLTASYTFYLFSGVAQIAFILGTTVVTYVSALLMQKKRDAYKAELAAIGPGITRDQKQELKKKTNNKIRVVQFASVIAVLLVLAVVKYLNFAIENTNTIFNVLDIDAYLSPVEKMIVPLGISFYSFQAMGYLIDIGRGRYAAEKHFGRLALFLSFFPTIVQGPINRYGDLGEQFKKEHSFDYKNLKFGAQLMLWGFFKKMVIADRAAPVVSAIFSENYADYNGSVYFFGMLMYALQIYGDFSGGIDIARGAAQMLGFNLPQNFERPYFSTSVADYWRRWHATLGAWMREYVFYPVMLSKPLTKISKALRKAGKAKLAKLVPSVVTPFVVFFLIGIWHGANWKYVAFGLYNATIVAGSVALAPFFKKTIEKLNINTEAFSWKLFTIVRTFLVLGISKILVKSPGIGAAFHIIKSLFTEIDLDFIFGLDGKIFTLGVDEKNMFILFVATLILLGVSVLQENGMKMRETLSKQNVVFRWAIYFIALIFILVFGIYGPAYNAADFIYQAY